jgi:hypothetical protein
MGGGCVGPGNTGTNEDPDPNSTKYADLLIGETFEHPGYCEWCTESSVNCSSAEFARAGNGQGKCKCRSFCNDACCRKVCRRVSYNGDAFKCCTSGNKVLGKGQTCNPIYRTYGTTVAPKTDCNEHMVKFCSIGNNLLKNDKCREWYNVHKDAADGVVLNVCNNPLYINDPACICIKAANEMVAKFGIKNKLAVECIDNRCVNSPTAFRTKNMRDNRCDIVNCDMSLEDVKLILSGNNSTLNAKFIQNCQGKNIVNNATPPPVNPTKPNTPPDPSNPANQPAKAWDYSKFPSDDDFSKLTPPAIVYILIILLVLSALAGGAFFLIIKFGDKKKKKVKKD